MITVAQLVEHLKTLPQDLPVVYQACSDMRELRIEDIGQVRGVKHHNLQDVVRDYYEWEWKKKKLVWACPKCHRWTSVPKEPDERCCFCKAAIMEKRIAEPEFVDVVQFPGN